jgi:hypothetical protein
MSCGYTRRAVVAVRPGPGPWCDNQSAGCATTRLMVTTAGLHKLGWELQKIIGSAFNLVGVGDFSR